MLINKFIRDASGLDIIPNLEFWKNVSSRIKVTIWDTASWVKKVSGRHHTLGYNTFAF